MADTAETTTSTASSTTTQQAPSAISHSAHNHLRQKRARSQLSCTPCRQGKLKCNRSHEPACDQCIKRNRESACIYVPPPAKNKPAQNVKGRIRQLESLVVDLMNQQQSKNGVQESRESVSSGTDTENPSGSSTSPEFGRPLGPMSQPTPPSDNDSSPELSEGKTVQAASSPESGVEKPFGAMKISKDEISYVGESHWQAILNGISDLKRELGDDDEGNEVHNPLNATGNDSAEPSEQTMNSWNNIPVGGVQPHASTGLGFMLGNSGTVTKEQLIQAVPDKKSADRLLSLWFNSPDPFKPIIHAPTFQDEYRRFWKNPKDTPVMWLGLLFAILSLAESFGLRDNNPASQAAQQCLAKVNKYHSMSASAAVLADFTKPKQYTLECLILYAAGLRSNNAFVNVWLMIGLIVRLALRMGYHRDPSQYPNISAFNGEMRRRVWAIISMIDVLISFQLGLPSMIRTIASDTEPPRNLLDRDFSVSTKVLPPGRGIHELTPSSYTRGKVRIVRIFAQASELSHATVPPSHEEVMLLDKQLEEAKAALPPLLQMPDISELVTDPAEQLMCRFNLDLLYMKTKTVLHRRYMLIPFSQLSPGEQAKGIGHSREVCVNCAMRVLQHHHTIYSASQPGGQLESVKWYMGSISTHDFLLAAMVLCLELSLQISETAMPKLSSGKECPKRRSMMDVLDQSQKIWSSNSGGQRKPEFNSGEGQTSEHMFDETEKASRAMAVMLERVKARFPSQKQNDVVLADWNNVGVDHEILESAGITTAGIGEKSGNGVLGVKSGNTPRTPFNGAIANFDWSGVPNSFDFTTPAAFTNGTGTSNGLAVNPVSWVDLHGHTHTVNTSGGGVDSYADNDVQAMDGIDYSMIGDMLDLPTNLDWNMWDTQVMSGAGQQQPQCTGWNGYPELSDAATKPHPLADGIHEEYSNRMFIPGNTAMANGTGPVMSNFTGSDFNIEAMADVDFDMQHLLDFDKGLWIGKSPRYKGSIPR